MLDNDDYWGMKADTYCMLLHLSQLTSLLLPGLGFVLPVIMWAANKEKSTKIDKHGKAATNWILSLIIYYLICSVLIITPVGALGILVLALFNLLFVIVAGQRAYQAQPWVYPLSIPFLK